MLARIVAGGFHDPDPALDDRPAIFGIGRRGVRGLRIIDSSIMPNFTSGNTNGPTMALASRGLELFLKDIGIEPSVSAGARAAPVDVPSNLNVVT